MAMVESTKYEPRNPNVSAPHSNANSAANAIPTSSVHHGAMSQFVAPSPTAYAPMPTKAACPRLT